jgi:hypothetical protein
MAVIEHTRAPISSCIRRKGCGRLQRRPMFRPLAWDTAQVRAPRAVSGREKRFGTDIYYMEAMIHYVSCINVVHCFCC